MILCSCPTKGIIVETDFSCECNSEIFIFVSKVSVLMTLRYDQCHNVIKILLVLLLNKPCQVCKDIYIFETNKLSELITIKKIEKWL